MEKVFIKKDSQVIGRAKEVATWVIPELQSFVDAAKAANIEFDFGRWRSIASNPRQYLLSTFIEKVREEDLVTTGSKLRTKSREQVAETALEFEGNRFDNFIQAGESLTRFITKQYNQTDYPFTELLSVENGKAVLNAEAVAELVESNTEYITDPKQIKIWEEADKLIQQVNSFNRLLRDEYGFPLTIERDYTITTVDEHSFKKWFKTDLNQKENLIRDPKTFLIIFKEIEKNAVTNTN